MEEKTIKWSVNHEEIFTEWADKAFCYSWMHNKSSIKYNKLQNLFTIPVIIMSTLTGTANFAIERVPKQYQSSIQICIGAVNIVAGIITTVQQFLKINELSENHKTSSLLWGKLNREITVELSKIQSERVDVTYLLKKCKEEFDRLMEVSPRPDSSSVKLFLKKFEKSKDWGILHKPDLCDTLVATKTLIASEEEKHIETEVSVLSNVIKHQRVVRESFDEIDKFVVNFNKEYNRYPSISEIFLNMSHISDTTIQLWKKKNCPNSKKIPEELESGIEIEIAD